MVLLALFCVGGCSLSSQGAPTPEPAAQPAVQPSPTPLILEALDPSGCEVHLWHSMTGAKEAELLDLAERFGEESANGIRVRVEHHSPLPDEVLAAAAAGTPPDLVVASCEQIGRYARADLIEPVDVYADSARFGLSALDRFDLWPYVLWGGCHLPDAVQGPGLFFDRQLIVMYYNATWLDELGAPSVPTTWEEFRELCNAARNPDGNTWGLATALDGSTVVNWIAGLGGQVVDVNTREALLDSPEAIAALSVLADILQDDCGHCVSGPEKLESFVEGKTLFTFGTTAELDGLSERLGSGQPELVWNVSPVPHLTEEPVVGITGSVLAMLRTTPRQQVAAWLFLRFLLEPANDARWAMATGALPTLRSTKYLPSMQGFMEARPQYVAALELLNHARPEPSVGGWGGIRELLASAANAVCEGQAAPVEILASVDSAADLLLRQ